MDASHFGMRDRPFRFTPEVDAYYPATTHEVALAELRRALQEEEGIALLTGGPGTGKTLLAHRLLAELPGDCRSVLITNTHLQSRSDLLQAILFDLSLPYQGMSEQELRLAFTDAALRQFAEGKQLIIVVDEAHLLPADLLEELRLLTNLESKDCKAVQVLLFGLPALTQLLQDPALTALRHRIVTRVHLEPLQPDEAMDYLLHRVRRVGGRPDQLFGEDVLDILSHACQGIPRTLNHATHLAFHLAWEAGNKQVDAEAAVEAVSRLGLDNAPEEKPATVSSEVSVPMSLRKGSETTAESLGIPAVTRPPLTIAPTTPDGPPTFIYGDEGSPLPEGSPPDWNSSTGPFPQTVRGKAG